MINVFYMFTCIFPIFIMLDENFYYTHSKLISIATINSSASLIAFSIILMVVFKNMKVKTIFAIATILFLILTLSLNNDPSMTTIYSFPMYSYGLYIIMFGINKVFY